MKQRTHHILPDVPRGYALPPSFSIVVPEATQNLITNPSFELATTGYSAVGGGTTIARSAAQQRFGVYSLLVTPPGTTTLEGVSYTLSLTAATYTLSAWIYGALNQPYILRANAGVSNVRDTPFIGTGRWQHVAVSLVIAASPTSTTVGFLTAERRSSVAFYTDGWQMEAKAYPTTYCDGDQAGFVVNQAPPAYFWDGTAHASTSQRSAQTRAGGRVYRLDRYGFVLLAIVGLGLASVQNVATPYAQLDGAQYHRTQKLPRQFTLAGRFDAATPAHLDRLISDLGEVLDRDRVGQQQPLLLRYQARDARDERPLGDEVDIPAVYTAGLEGNLDNLYSETAPLTFTTYLPAVYGVDAGAALTVQQSVSNANYILKRSSSGTWSAIGTGAAGGNVLSIAYNPIDGKIYISGTFTSFNGVANTRGICVYDPTSDTVSALGTGAPALAEVEALAIAPDGAVVAVGLFTGMGGVANTANIAKYTGGAWTSITPLGAANLVLHQAVYGPDGTLYAGGAITSINGVAVNRLASYNGTTWSNYGSGVWAAVFSLAFGRNGKLYASPGTELYRRDGAAWTMIGDPTGGSLSITYAILGGSDGIMYFGGDFASVSGVTSRAIIKYNDVSFIPMTGIDSTGQVRVIRETPRGQLVLGGTFLSANSVTFPDALALWNGAAFVPFDTDLPGTAVTYAVAILPDGTTYIGYDTNGTATAAGITTVTNNGTAKAYPRVIIKGPTSGTSRIYQLVNYTTGRAIYLNLTINAGETVKIDLDPARLSFLSDFQGNIANTVLPGSNTADFFLQPGANIISFFAASSTVTATMQWRTAYSSIRDATH